MLFGVSCLFIFLFLLLVLVSRVPEIHYDIRYSGNDATKALWIKAGIMNQLKHSVL